METQPKTSELEPFDLAAEAKRDAKFLYDLEGTVEERERAWDRLTAFADHAEAMIGNALEHMLSYGHTLDCAGDVLCGSAKRCTCGVEQKLNRVIKQTARVYWFEMAHGGGGE